MSQKKTGYLVVFNTLIEIQRAYDFIRKGKENQMEIYKTRKYEIKINVDFYMLYRGRLENLEKDLKSLIRNLYLKARSGRASDKRSHFRRFSSIFNNYMVAFYGKTNMEQRFSALFLKVFQNFFFKQFIKAVIRNKNLRVG